MWNRDGHVSICTCCIRPSPRYQASKRSFTKVREDALHLLHVLRFRHWGGGGGGDNGHINGAPASPPPGSGTAASAEWFRGGGASAPPRQHHHTGGDVGFGFGGASSSLGRPLLAPVSEATLPLEGGPASRSAAAAAARPSASLVTLSTPVVLTGNLQVRRREMKCELCVYILYTVSLGIDAYAQITLWVHTFSCPLPVGRLPSLPAQHLARLCNVSEICLFDSLFVGMRSQCLRPSRVDQ